MSQVQPISNRRTALLEKVASFFLGKTATHCAECGASIPADGGYRVLPMQVYCNEAHAVADQRMPAM